MSKRRNIIWEDILDFAKSKGFNILELNYKDKTSRIHLIDCFGYKYCMEYVRFVNGHMPPIFSKWNPYTIQNINLWLKINEKSFDLISDVFPDYKSPIEFKCKNENCEEYFTLSIEAVFSGQGCPYCAGKRVGIKNSFVYNNPDIAKEWNYSLNEGLTPDMFLNKSGKYAWWTCSRNSEHVWKARIADRSNGRGCPICKESRGEKRISEILGSLNIKYDRWYNKFEKLKSIKNRPLTFDFVLRNNENKIFAAIEYDGIQHYRVIDGWTTYEEYVDCVLNDCLKDEFCRENKIPLLRIPYYQFNQADYQIEHFLERIQDGYKF